VSGDPKVSVVVVAFNAAPYIEETLAGIAAQDVDGVEVFVADDDSTDATRDLATGFDGLDTEVVTGPRVGIGGNVARAVERCSGEYLALVAGDDRWRPGHLKAALEALDDNPAASLSYSIVGRIDQDGHQLTAPPTRRMRKPRSGAVDPEEILYSNFIDFWGVVMRAEALRDVGGVDPDLDLVEWDMLIRLVAWGPVIYIPQATVDYRVHSGGVSGSTGFMLNGRLAVYRKHVHDFAEIKRLTARTFLRAAYPELWPAPTSESVRRGRRLLYAAFRTRPGILTDRRFVPLLLSSHADGLYVAAVNRFGDRFRMARVKLLLQRLFGMGS
jgi:glycosyltransferase involved in cell wall biosynthesis